MFEEFRNVCYENYKLEPAWYYSAPGLAWIGGLKVTEVELKLFSGVDKLLMYMKKEFGEVFQ